MERTWALPCTGCEILRNLPTFSEDVCSFLKMDKIFASQSFHKSYRRKMKINTWPRD